MAELVLTTRTHFYGEFSPFLKKTSIFLSNLFFFFFRSLDRGAHGRQHSRTIFTLAMCDFLATFFSYSFINSHLLRIGTILASVDIVMGERFTIWILWIFFLIISALVTVCSRTFFIQCCSYILL